MEHRLAYILQHFYMAYPQARHLKIAYGTDASATEAKVTVTAYSGDFFNARQAHPKHVIWKNSQGVSLPFFFDTDSAEELVTFHTDGRTRINYDIIASAFYLLSGWQEYHSPRRDAFGRYPYADSTQHRYGMAEVPVVNYYFELLRETLEHAYGVQLQAKRWGSHTFATCLTCDVDRLQSAWKVAGLQALKKGRIASTASLLVKKMFRQDAWDNLNQVADTASRFGARLSFFFLPVRQKVHRHPNADYSIKSPAVQAKIKHLAAKGHEIGLHSSFGTALDSDQLQREQKMLPVQVSGNRFHYLCHNPEITPEVLEKCLLAYDTTLGFAEHIGFRNSYCLPFYPFDFGNNKPYTYLELPLLLMDTTLYNPNYMHLRPSEVMERLQPMVQEVARFKGICTLLWHNENFSKYSAIPTPAGEPMWCEVLAQLLRYLKQQSTVFLTCSEALAQFQEAVIKDKNCG
ncbi:DUF7033 domain-containing protein [Pontibacter sp. CAU 1760]